MSSSTKNTKARGPTGARPSPIKTTGSPLPPAGANGSRRAPAAPGNRSPVAGNRPGPGNRSPVAASARTPAAGRTSPTRSPMAGRSPLASSNRSPMRGDPSRSTKAGQKAGPKDPKSPSRASTGAASPTPKKSTVSSPLRYRNGQLTPRSKIRAEKEEKLRLKKEEEAHLQKLEEQRLEEEARVKKEQEKKRKIQEALQAKLDARKAAETSLLQARTALREKENARKRLHHHEREMESAWPYKMRLHYAALEGDIQLAGSLLAQDTEDSFNSNKIDPNFQWREDGQAPLHFAVVKGQVTVIRMLLAAKALPDIRDNDERSPLMVAAEHGQVASAKILVEASAEVNASDRRGRTPLHVAAQAAQSGVVRLLLALGASPLARTHTQGWTPLHVAAASKYQSMEVVWLLLGGHRLPATAGQAPAAEASDSDSDGNASELEAEEPGAASRGVRVLGEDGAWEAHVAEFVSEATRNRLALERLQRKYPREWLYNDDRELLDLCLQRCPGLPLPPYVSSLSLRSNMEYTALDEAPPGSAIRLALEAAVLLDNELVEREAEDNEKETGVIRAPSIPNAPRQLARLRTRKLALVIGNAAGPGTEVTAVCKDDAAQVGKHLGLLGFQVVLKIDADRLEMLQVVDEIRGRIEEGDCVVFYFSGHARRVHGVDYLVPAKCRPDALDEASKFEANAVRLREDVIARLQVQTGTLCIFFLDVFRGSPSIPAPAGCGRWRQGKGDWPKRVPAAFLPHIRPPGTPASSVQHPEEGAPPWEGPRMEGSMDGVEANRWALLAGSAIGAVEEIEQLLAEDGSVCVVYSHEPGGTLFPNEPVLLSPFTHVFLKHVHNPGGGANGCGGGYPMMLADIKSEVMRESRGRQCPWTYSTPEADGIFSFCPAEAPAGRSQRRPRSPREAEPRGRAPRTQKGALRTASA